MGNTEWQVQEPLTILSCWTEMYFRKDIWNYSTDKWHENEQNLLQNNSCTCRHAIATYMIFNTYVYVYIEHKLNMHRDFLLHKINHRLCFCRQGANSRLNKRDKQQMYRCKSYIHILKACVTVFIFRSTTRREMLRTLIICALWQAYLLFRPPRCIVVQYILAKCRCARQAMSTRYE